MDDSWSRMMRWCDDPDGVLNLEKGDSPYWILEFGLSSLPVTVANEAEELEDDVWCDTCARKIVVLLQSDTRFITLVFSRTVYKTCNLRSQCGITISSANQDLDCLDTRLPALLAQVPRDITRRVDRVIVTLCASESCWLLHSHNSYLRCVQLWSVAV